jgi:hypothetical protein
MSLHFQIARVIFWGYVLLRSSGFSLARDDTLKLMRIREGLLYFEVVRDVGLKCNLPFYRPASILLQGL